MHFWVVESRPAFAMSPCQAYTAAQIRLYRVRWFFEHLEYNLTLSLLWVTLVRNLVVRPYSPEPAFTTSPYEYLPIST